MSKRRSRIGWVRRFCDFKPLGQISAGAALAVAAEFDRVSRVTGIPPATIDVDQWDSHVATVLSRLGFFKLLRLRPAIAEPPDALIVKPMISGEKVNGGLATPAIKELFEEIGGDRDLRIKMSSAMNDAMENVVAHAYPKEWSELRHLVPRWWLVGAADPVNRRLTLAVIDHGITIPKSLPRTQSADLVGKVFSRLFRASWDQYDPASDGRAIQAAMELGATSTGEHFRGKGLQKIREIIRECPEGRLRIVSGHGEYSVEANGNETVRSHEIPLLGTYVELEAVFGEDVIQ